MYKRTDNWNIEIGRLETSLKNTINQYLLHQSK